MRLRTLAVLVALLAATPALTAQHAGPTVAAARAAFAMAGATDHPPPLLRAPASCGSALKNAALLGLGLSLATAVIEGLYTLVREPLIRNGHDVPGADPAIIAWAGAAGFVAGVVGTHVCRRRR